MPVAPIRVEPKQYQFRGGNAQTPKAVASKTSAEIAVQSPAEGWVQWRDQSPRSGAGARCTLSRAQLELLWLSYYGHGPGLMFQLYRYALKLSH